MKSCFISPILCLLVSTTALTVFAHEAQGNSSSGSQANHPVTAIGEPVQSTKFTRTIEISMNDQMRFEPNQISVKKGEIVKLVVKNIGKVKHEIVIGSSAELKEHAEMMKQMPGMKHDDPSKLTVEPGMSGEMVWKFSKVGSLEYACLQPGHNEAGMNGKITVK